MLPSRSGPLMRRSSSRTAGVETDMDRLLGEGRPMAMGAPRRAGYCQTPCWKSRPAPDIGCLDALAHPTVRSKNARGGNHAGTTSAEPPHRRMHAPARLLGGMACRGG